MTDINTAVQAIIDRVAAQAAASNPNDLVYLGKAIEAISPANAAQFVVQVGENEKLGIQSAGAAQLAALQAYIASTTDGPAWTVKSAAYTATDRDAILADTSTAAFTLTLPIAPATNDYVLIADAAGTFDTHPLIVARNGKLIMGVADDLSLNLKNASVHLMYTGLAQGWRLI